MKVYLNLDLDLDEMITKELIWYIKAKLPEIINEFFFEHPQELNKLIKEVVKSELKSTCHSIFQGKELKEILAERILKGLEINNNEII